jgi:hypothetical protein
MPRGTARAAGLIERAVAEAIGAVAAPVVRDEVIELALRWAGCAAVPERGPAVASFVEGPLFRALVHVLGEPSASTVCDELAAVTAMVMDEEVSEIRPSWPVLALDPAEDDPELIIEMEAEVVEVSSVPTATDPAPRRDLPLLVVASSSPTTLSMLSVALGGAAYIEPARDALALLEGLGRNDAGLIVLDCKRPTVQVETLLAMQPELPAGLRVVLFGEPRGLERHLEAAGAEMPASWICCGTDASVEDLAAVCRVLLG